MVDFMSKEYWIQGSIMHKGRVHRYLERLYGAKAFTCHMGHQARCTIKPHYLDLACKRAEKEGNLSLYRALEEAKTLRKFAQHRMAYA